MLAFLVVACGDDDPAVPDAATPSIIDAAAPDAPTPDAGDPNLLSSWGLYSDIDTKTIASDVVEFRPTHALWSDAAVKRRWIRLPPGTQIDTGNMDRWEFPIGTRLYKEFVRDGVLVETRIIEKRGDGREDYFMGAFIWDLDETDAVFAAEGGIDVNGTGHDVPDEDTCWTCHFGDVNRALGFSAIQLSRPDDPPNLDSLAADGLLTDPPPAGEDYAVPGNAVEVAALGYMHANCGHCHNETGTSRPDTNLILRLEVADRTVEDTTIYRSTVDVALDNFLVPPFTTRVVPGDPDASGLVHRMAVRGTMDEMPPLATEIVDDDGVAAVSAWIEALSTM